jgi:hypothetical protein
VRLNLAGLGIRTIDDGGDEPAAGGAGDLVWRRHRVASLGGEAPAEGPFTLVRGQPGEGGTRTDFRFGRLGRLYCRFVVGAAGRSVESWAVPDVSDRDLLALFGEHILRTVLVRRGLVSFHAAALAGGDGAVLVMGDKGMGKSTLSSALQQRGWSCVADDLARVAEDEAGAWRTFAGLRDTKLLADSIAALGLAPAALPPRWDDSGGGGGDKRLLAPVDGAAFDARALRLTGLLVLAPRARDALSHRIVSPVEAVRALLAHATGDPLAPGAPPPPPVQRAIGALVRRLPVIELALPDRLEALGASAEAVEALVGRLGARRAA